MRTRSIHTLAIVVLAAATLVLSACSKNEPPPPPAASAPPPAPAGLAPSDSDKQTAIGRALDSARAIAGTQATAAQLQSLYAPQLDALKTGLAAAQPVMESKAAAVLPAAATSAYSQLKTLVPELGELVDSLKQYPSDAPTDLVQRLQTDFAKAQSLYAQVKPLLGK
ncbi:hypothetical protein OH491_12705 [Termitidicoccus mucosus]|uniref:Lipoprotein n=1 Tax=Termitidicoccus mucosus TaxID=1184151 RepID=A0A178IGG9_9BACT|nr:hypothetical protein AW736_14760 [Opitutaceae bacterium TSB47]